MEKKKAYAVSTAHLDTVWRWTISKTINEFIPDTLTKNFDLIEKYPNYKFNFEGAYRYEIIEQIYPKAFSLIKQYVDEDRWCLSGTGYENGDVNIPSPEALIRNLLIGNYYFTKKFGTTSKDMFLPDCFGFGWALPSVANHCGLLGMTTQKLSWGSAYGLPFDLGKWVGPDGKGIYVSLNAKSYRYKFSGDIRADLSVINNISDNAKNSELPWANHLYGTGDWGGAPDEESVKAVELSVGKNEKSDFEVISAHTDTVFKDLKKLPKADRDKIPVWNNELLMTSHGAGCYTSRAMSKRLNRQCEQMALAAEKACVLAYSLGGYDYPIATLTNAWKRVVKHQFHDDITGTSVMEAYNKSWNDYYVSLSQFKNEYLGASKAIFNQMNTSWIDKKSVAVMVSNTTQFRRNDAVECIVKTPVNCTNLRAYDMNGNELPCQVINKNGKNLTVVFKTDIEPLSFKVFQLVPSKEPTPLTSDVKVTNHSLENSKYKLIFNKNGDIAYLYDKELGRQVLDKPVKMALLHNTGSLAYPSWEIRKEDIDKEPYCYANTPEFTVLENGPARVAIKVTRSAGSSVISQVVSLESESKYVNVTNYVDWKSRRTMLKAVFPTAAYNEKATYDLGLGVIKRGNNTDSLYEVPAQKWADITDENGKFGVSILSDCKIGWDKPNDNTLRLTCIHTPAGAFTKETRQDLQDLGRNIFSFAIYSHSNGFEEGTQKQAEIYTNQLIAVQSDIRSNPEASDSIAIAGISNDDVILRTIKMSEEGDGIIVRVYEANGKSHSKVKLKIFNEIGEAYSVDGLENTIRKIKNSEHEISFSINPFEVKSFKIVYKERPKRIPRHHYLPLTMYCNAKGFSRIYKSEMKHTILNGAGFSLPYEELPLKVDAGGIRFKFFQDPQNRYDVMVCRGQYVKCGERGENRLYFLAGSTNGKQEIKVKVGNKLVPLTIKPINENLSQWDMAGLNQIANVNPYEKVGYQFRYVNHPEGLIPENATFYVYSLNISDTNVIEFPDNNKVVILAMTILKESSRCALISKIEDTANKDYAFYDDVAPIEKIIDKADFLTIRAGKIQDQKNGGKGKGFKRDNIVTNIIRSYTKSEW